MLNESVTVYCGGHVTLNDGSWFMIIKCLVKGASPREHLLGFLFTEPGVRSQPVRGLWLASAHCGPGVEHCCKNQGVNIGKNGPSGSRRKGGRGFWIGCVQGPPQRFLHDTVYAGIIHSHKVTEQTQVPSSWNVWGHVVCVYNGYFFHP